MEHGKRMKKANDPIFFSKGDGFKGYSKPGGTEKTDRSNREVEIGYKTYLPNFKSIKNKLKAKKRLSHQRFDKPKSSEDTLKMMSYKQDQKDPNSSIRKDEFPKKILEINGKKPVVPTSDMVAEFYMTEKRKLNIWTYLFRSVYTSLNQIVKMCEIERKVEFCTGVIETLKNYIKEVEKVSNSIRIEDQMKKKKSMAWEIRASPNKETSTLEDINKINDKKVDVFFDDQGMVEFKLLNELVINGKLSFYDAIVMIIRERAVLFDMIATEDPENYFREFQEKEESNSASRGSFVNQHSTSIGLIIDKYSYFRGLLLGGF